MAQPKLSRVAQPKLRTLDQVMVEPSTATFLLPTIGHKSETVKLRIVNPTNKRLTFKMKSTLVDHFKIRPIFGFIERINYATVRCIPKKFDEHDETISFKDHFTVLVNHASKKDDNAAKLWVHHSGSEKGRPKDKRIIVRIVYGKRARVQRRSKSTVLSSVEAMKPTWTTAAFTSMNISAQSSSSSEGSSKDSTKAHTPDKKLDKGQGDKAAEESTEESAEQTTGKTTDQDTEESTDQDTEESTEDSTEETDDDDNPSEDVIHVL